MNSVAHRVGDLHEMAPFIELLKRDPLQAWNRATNGVELLVAAEYLGADMGLLNSIADEIAELARAFRKRLRDEVMQERALNNEHWHSHLVCGIAACTNAIGISIHGRFHTYYYPATAAHNYIYAHVIAWSEEGTDIMTHRAKGTDLADLETARLVRSRVRIVDMPGLADIRKRRALV